MLGDIMRSVVGPHRSTVGRSEMKTEFRMPVTQVKVAENNPLHFAANAEDALGSLLGQRNSAYLPPQEAFDDAFNDVRFHQLAMLAGASGFDNLMNRFDPAQLQEGFERQANAACSEAVARRRTGNATPSASRKCPRIATIHSDAYSARSSHAPTNNDSAF